MITSTPALALDPPFPPELEEGAGIIKDKEWAIVLGKALFWDMQVGSDGMSCASCHFSAGADSRITNQLSPGFKALPVDTSYGCSGGSECTPGHTASGAKAGPNYTLKPEDFPFSQFADENDRNSELLFKMEDRVASSGSFDAELERVHRLFGLEDECGEASADVFHAGGRAARMVEPRNTPTTINAVFYHRNFWDGRANNIFNGYGVFGMREIENDPKARIVVSRGWFGADLETMAIPNASLASQAMGPPLSNEEMSCRNRSFAEIGRKLLLRRPLKMQDVDANDSVFGRYGPKGDLRARRWLARGLDWRHRYGELIKRAFHEKYWRVPGRFEITDDGELRRNGRNGYSQMEINFGMFWGIAIMMYESTLISDDSRFDRADAAGCFGPPGSGFRINPRVREEDCVVNGETLWTVEEDIGRRVFFGIGPPGSGRCFTCHNGPLFSLAAFEQGEHFEQMDREAAGATGIPNVLHEEGFFNIGVVDVHTDLGVGGTDPWGNPLSYSRQFLHELEAPGSAVDPLDQHPCEIGIGAVPYDCDEDGNLLNVDEIIAGERVMVDGTFKTPGLRNIALTPPYFHYGGYATLRQVVDFYNRAGNHRDFDLETTGLTGDTSGTGPRGQAFIDEDGTMHLDGNDRGSNVDIRIRPLNLTEEQKEGLVAFMLALTDERVQCDQAPFDHPSLYLFNGHTETDYDRNGRADDVVFELPAVGRDGYRGYQSKYCIPNEGDLFAPGMGARVGEPDGLDGRRGSSAP